MPANPKIGPIVQSDSLPGLLELMDKVGGSRSVFGDVLHPKSIFDVLKIHQLVACACNYNYVFHLAIAKDGSPLVSVLAP
jgi:hypothetical protein